MGTFSRDERIMKRVIGLAKRGRGFVSPNPLVGCLIYKDNVKIGEGYHEVFGGHHAEVNAIGSVVNPRDCVGAELFVNLEPCCHFGKTPPCTDLIIKSGIKRVVISNKDPFVKVQGKGIETLKKAGIEVVTDIMSLLGSELNESFIFSQSNQKPYVTLKIAQTIDGKIATRSGDSKWISNEKSRLDVQRLRFESDAILTGIGTVLSDNPKLTVRMEKLKNKQPFRIVLDSHLQIPLDSYLVSDEFANKTVVMFSNGNEETIKQLKLKKIQVVKIGKSFDGQLNLNEVMEWCFNNGLHRILVESGGVLGSKLIESNHVNKVIIYQAPKWLGSGKSFFSLEHGILKMDDAINLTLHSADIFGDDVKLTYYLK